MTKRDVGRMAEAKLEEWAHQVGITPNKAKHDKEGWDYLLQFPYETEVSAPTLDQRASRIECLVQVKGTDSAKKRRSIKLNIWDRLARTPFPSFFLVVDYASRNQPNEAYLIHIDKSWIDSVLYRLRQLGPNKLQDLNSRTMDLNWSKQDRLSSLDGDGLKEAILPHIETGMAEYCQKKIKLLGNAGDPIPYLLEVSSNFDSEEDLWDTLIDFAIGLQETLPISKLLVKKDIRFDIPATVQNKGEGLLQVKRLPAIECIINFQNDLGTLVSSFSADLYTPYWLFPGQDIPKRYFRERAVFEIGEAIIQPSHQELRASFRFGEAESTKALVDHANLWRLVLIINELAGFTVEIMSKDGLVMGSGRLDSSLAVDLDDELLEIARDVDNAYFVARYFGVPINKMVRLDQIVLQRKQLDQLRRICDVNHRITAVTGSGNLESELSEEVATPIVRRILFGDISLLAVVVVAGRLSVIAVSEDNSQDWIIEKPRRILQQHTIVSNDRFAPTHVDSLVDEIVQRLDEQGIDAIVPADADRRDMG